MGRGVSTERVRTFQDNCSRDLGWRLHTGLLTKSCDVVGFLMRGNFGGGGKPGAWLLKMRK
jgi:hypothetical protein